MKIQFNKTLITIGFGLVASTLAACGTPSGNSLVGVAGQPTETQTSAPASTTDLPVVPTASPIPESAGHIVFVSDRDGQKSLYITSPNGTDQTRITEMTSENPRLSPDGTRVAFVSNDNGNMDIYVLEIATHSTIRITDAPEKDASPSWSPDGTKIAFESFRDGNFEIYMVNADGSNPIRLTNDPAGDTDPIWSPVANEIIFVSNRFGNADIFLLTPSGNVTTLTTNTAPDSAPAWSPDGNMIAYKAYSGELANLCLIRRDGLNQRCVTTAPSDYGTPVWSPDNESLAVNAKQNAGYGITIFNLKDNSTIQLSSPGIDPRGDPVWSPEGLRLVIQAQSNGNMELFILLVSTNQFTPLTTVNAYDGEPIWGRQ